MITRTHWLAALFLGGSLALAGCGNSAHVSAPSSAKNSSSSHGKTSGPMKRHCISSSYSIFTSLDPHWIMPNRVPSSSVNARRNWPIYNTQLAMNQFPASWHGNDLINTWKLPPRWVPYLSKNEKQASPFVNGHPKYKQDSFNPLHHSTGDGLLVSADHHAIPMANSPHHRRYPSDHHCRRICPVKVSGRSGNHSRKLKPTDFFRLCVLDMAKGTGNDSISN